MTLAGYLQDEIGDGLRAPVAQPITVAPATSGTLAIVCWRARGARVNLTGGRLIWTLDDGQGGLVEEVAATLTAPALGEASIAYSAAAAAAPSFVDLIPRYDVAFLDDAGNYGVAGATYELIPPSHRLLA